MARAFGAKGVFIEGEDTHLIDSIKKATEVWGGSSYFKVETISDGKSLVSQWRNKGGITIHLTMYGINVCEKIKELSSFEVPLLIIVGSEKVDSWYYHNVDFNLAIGNQPHSEIAALAIFLDRLYKGLELHYIFEDSKLRVIPQEAGKKVVKMVSSEELFVSLAESLLGEDVVSVLKLLLDEGVEMTDDEIANKLNMKVNDVRKRLYSLSEQGFVVSRRTREKEKGWYIYFWKPNLDHINEILIERKRQILNKLQSRLEYESSNTFYICSRDMNRYSFEEAFEMNLSVLDVVPH